MIRYEQAWIAKSESLMTTEEALAQLFAEEIAKESRFQEMVFDCKSKNENHEIAFCIYDTELGFFIDLQLKNKGSDVMELKNKVGTVYDPLPSNFQKLATILDYLNVSEIEHRYTHEGFPRNFVVAPSNPFKSLSE
jgi:hypothetical protein